MLRSVQKVGSMYFPSAISVIRNSDLLAAVVPANVNYSHTECT